MSKPNLESAVLQMAGNIAARLRCWRRGHQWSLFVLQSPSHFLVTFECGYCDAVFIGKKVRGIFTSYVQRTQPPDGKEPA